MRKWKEREEAAASFGCQCSECSGKLKSSEGCIHPSTGGPHSQEAEEVRRGGWGGGCPAQGGCKRGRHFLLILKLDCGN